MSGQHTPGRLHVCSHYSFNIRDEAGKWFASTKTIFNSVEAKQQDEANARRSVACWNALIGVDQETLDMGWTGIGAMQIAHKHEERSASLSKELAAARALLREVLASDDEAISDAEMVGLGFPPELTELTERLRNYLDACDTLGDGNG